MPDSYPLRDWHRVAVELLLSDADLALLSIAWLTRREAEEHIVAKARSACESIQKKRDELQLTESEAAAVQKRIDQLRAELRWVSEAG